MFEFQIIGAYFPNDNHRDYIIDTILNISPFPIEFFIGDFNASLSEHDVKNCHPHFFDSIQCILIYQSLLDVYHTNSPYGTQTSFYDRSGRWSSRIDYICSSASALHLCQLSDDDFITVPVSDHHLVQCTIKPHFLNIQNCKTILPTHLLCDEWFCDNTHLYLRNALFAA